MLYKIDALIHDKFEGLDKILSCRFETDKEIGFASRLRLEGKSFGDRIAYALCAEPCQLQEVNGLATVISLIDDKPLLDKECEQTIKAVCSYYKTGIYTVLKMVLPSVDEKEIKQGVAYYQASVPRPMGDISKSEYRIYEEIKKAGRVKASTFGNKNTVNRLLTNKYIFKIMIEEESLCQPIFLDRPLGDVEKKAVNLFNGDDRMCLLHINDQLSKIEIALQLVKEAVLKGQSVLLLEPQMTGGNPLFELFKKVFQDNLFLYHNRLSNQQKCSVFYEVANRKSVVVIGEESAAFLPIKNLGLIIIDQEENSRYKQSEAPFINFKKVAFERAEISKAKLIMTSCAPSIETYARALKGYYNLIDCTNSSKRPYELIDLSEVDEIDTKSILLTKKLRSIIKKTIDANEKIIIYHTKRGYSPIMRCDSCGKDYICPSCNALMTYYKLDEELRCNHCGYLTSAKNLSCARCSGRDFSPIQYGTMRLEEELNLLFDGIRVSRVDYDSVLDGDYSEYLTQFALGQSDVLLGTKMIVSNYYQPNIGLIIAFDLDWILQVPDYMIEEDYFDFLANLASHMKEGKKSIYLGTYLAKNPTIKMLSAQDYQEFYKSTLNKRRMGLNPPYTYLVHLDLLSLDQLALEKMLEKIKQFMLKELSGKKTVLVGPSLVKFDQKKRGFQSRIIVKYRSREDIEFLLDKLATIRLPRDIRLGINIDPKGE